MKELNDKLCERLRNDIQHIKTERVRLIKQIKEESATHRRYRTEKEKEMAKLKTMDKKRMSEICKLQEGNSEQESVLRHKNDAISHIQRQLRETSEKLKKVQDKRQQTYDKKDTSTQSEKLRNWITQEIELVVGIQEARANLNKLLQERREAAAELEALKREYEEYADECGGATYGAKRNRSVIWAPHQQSFQIVQAKKTRVADCIEVIWS
jgi:kinesin family member 4